MALGFNWLLILTSADSTCASLPTELAGDFRYVLPLETGNRQFILAGLARPVDIGQSGCSVRCSARNLFHVKQPLF